MSAVEVLSVEAPVEVPGKDWRRSLRRVREGLRKQIRKERAAGSSEPYDCDGQIWLAKDLDDEDLERVAYSYAVRTVEAAIRQEESEAISHRVKRRKGEAL